MEVAWSGNLYGVFWVITKSDWDLEVIRKTTNGHGCFAMATEQRPCPQDGGTGLFLAHQARGDIFQLGHEVFLLLVGELHVFEGVGGRGDETVDVVVVFGGGEFGHEVLVGGELRDDGGDVGIACQFADLVCNVLVAKNFVENTHNDVRLILWGKDTHFSWNG